MKDYSEFIRNEYGFITKIKPNLENKTIEVTTSKSKEGKPHIYELNRKNLKKLYTRLENQYKLLIENKDSVLKQLENKREKTFKIAEISGVGATIIILLVALLSEFNILFALGLIPSIGAITGTIISKSQFKKDFEDMIETYHYFLANKEEIEALSKSDDNVTKDITIHTHNELITSEKLLNEQLIDEQYTIGLIDSLPLKDLKEISLRFKISKALDSDPYFYIEEPVSTEEITEIVVEEIETEEKGIKRTLHK